MRPLRARRDDDAAEPRRGRVKSALRQSEKRFEPRASASGGRRSVMSRALRALLRNWLARRPMLGLTLSLLIIGAIAGVVISGYPRMVAGQTMRHTHGIFAGLGFHVADIVLNGNVRTARDDVLGTLGFGPGDSTFAVDPAAARARLLQLPWVSDAEVNRRFPGSVTVTLIEKRPYALWRDGDALKVVERSGVVITSAHVQEFARLPLLMGAGAPQAAAPLLDEVEKHRAVAARLRWAERVSDRRWNLMLDSKVQVKLPEEGWQSQVAELDRLIVEKGVLERDIEMIDLRFPDNYIFRLRNGDSQPVTRKRPT